MTHRHHAAVVTLMRQVADEVVLPSFRNLAASDIEEKAPDDLVTVADRESERRLTAGLIAIDPAARVIGEEATAADPKLLDGITRGRVWIVDPIDGTNNYAHGRTPFGIMIALVEDGVTQAGWILDPVTGRLCHATLGDGAFIDGERVTARPSGAPLPIAALATYFMSDDAIAAMMLRCEGRLTCAPNPRCAAEQYPRVVLGQNDIVLFQRTLPWDHAAGALFVHEAGGVVKRPDGEPYVVGDLRRGMIAAASPALWDEAVSVLFG